jgi:hypothetical protein
MTPPDDERPDLGEMIFRLAQDMVKLEPGSLARLRRMVPDGAGEGDFWVLAADHPGLRTDTAGMMLVRLLALLTPKGRPDSGKKLHHGQHAFGAALAEAAYPETRLLRFLALPFEARGHALEGMVRWIAAKGHEGLNATDIACLLFSPDVKHARRLAQTYFDTLRKKKADKKDDAA